VEYVIWVQTFRAYRNLPQKSQCVEIDFVTMTLQRRRRFIKIQNPVSKIKFWTRVDMQWHHNKQYSGRVKDVEGYNNWEGHMTCRVFSRVLKRMREEGWLWLVAEFMPVAWKRVRVTIQTETQVCGSETVCAVCAVGQGTLWQPITITTRLVWTQVRAPFW
jgi:hypothetical protein